MVPWNDINILVVTDVHSWIGSHERHTTTSRAAMTISSMATSATASTATTYDDYDDTQVDTHSKMDADYGDILSFYQRLQEELQNWNNDNKNKKKRRELFFVMNGDFMDGTVRYSYVCNDAMLCHSSETTIFFLSLLYRFGFFILTHSLTQHTPLLPSFLPSFLPCFLFHIPKKNAHTARVYQRYHLFI